MKKLLLFWVLFVCFHVVTAQTFTANFTGTAASIPQTAASFKCFPVTVTGVGAINGTTNGLTSVCLNITHPNDDELEINLTAPDGTIVPLSIQNGGTGDNYTGTCFTATATTAIGAGTAPFTGTFLPEGHLGAVNNGQNANGVWTVCVQDRRNAANLGSLTSFSLTFSNTPAPVPPALPTCSTTLPATSTCANATSVCNFSGLCGNTSGSTVSTWATLTAAACFGLENNSFIKFVASGTSASFSVWVPTRSSGGAYFNGGIQMLFFSGTCGSGPVTTYGCYPHIYPYGPTGLPIISVVTATGLTPGNTYYLMMDGFNGDRCNFTIEAINGVSILNITPPAPAICAGGSVNLTASGGTTYSWSPAATLSSPTGPTVTATPTATTTYTVTSTPNGSCPITENVTVIVNPRPVISGNPSNATQNICVGGPSTALTVTATAGSGTITGYQWYSNTTASTTGGTLIAGATSATYTPPTGTVGTLYYYCVITNSNTCFNTTTVSGAVNVFAALTAPVGTVTQQPTCTTPSGTITITSPLGANYQYSIGGAYQVSPVFTGLASNTYNVTVKDMVTGCISPVLPLTVNTIAGAPATPTASVTQQPTCTTPTGTITITAPTGANLQYSIGGAYQTSGIFTGLAPNTYNVTVKDIVTGCISSPLPLIVNTVPLPPAAPTASVTQQPTCTTPSGTITITAPTGANYQYSIGGAYQTGTVFSGLASNTYSVTVQDVTTGCISSATPLTVNTITGAPATPTGSVTQQPTCTTPSGTITITSPTGANLQYSIGGAYQTSGIFTGLAPNTYNVTVKNMVTGCISSVLPLTVNTLPALPATPTGTVTQQPTCIVPTGTITITAPTGANLQYSVGGVYQVSPVFTGLVPNTYVVTVKDVVTGCVSLVLPLTVNQVPVAPAVVASVTQQPTCITPSGTITITAPLGANYQYSIGGTYQTGTIFSGLAPNTYSVTVKDIVTGCISAPLPLTVNTVPAAPVTPVATVTQQPTCTTPTGTITITSPTGANLQYSIGGAYQTSTVFNGLAPNNYSVTVKDIVTGCVSAPLPLTVNTVPGAPATPTATVTQQPTCTVPTGTIVITAPTGANYQYSVGGAYQAGTTFSGLAANNYNVTVKDIVTGCTSAPLPLVVNTVPTQAAPTATATAQPTCVNGGTITVTNPVGANYQYSIDGGTNWQSGTTFTSLPAATYTVIVKNTTTGCVSASGATVILTAPAAVATPTVTTVQPTCTVPTGSITFNSPSGANLQYAVTGVYQTSPVFTGLVPATYHATVKNTITGCVSTDVVVTITAASALTVSASVTTQTTCTDQGVITVTAPIGAGYLYSIDNVNYQASTSFPNLLPGNYNVSVKNAANCVSPSIPLTINPVPPPPATPVASVTKQPTCGDNTGTITVTSPTGANIRYSIDGMVFQPGLVFTNLAPGNYPVTVQDISTNCKSAANILQVNVVPGAPAQPTGTITQPTCAVVKGTITINTPTGANFQYSLNSGTYQTSPVFSGLDAGTYNVKVKNTTTNCESAAANFIVNIVPSGPAAPATTGGAVCGSGTVALSANASGTITWYSDAALTNVVASGNTFSPSVSVTTTFYVTNTVGGCASTAATAVASVNALPAPNLGQNRSVCKIDNITLSPGSFSSYLWQDNSTAPTFRVLVSSTYSVKVKNAAGCENTASVKIEVVDQCDDIYFPTAFTPNNDSKNDEFGPLPASSLGFVTGYTLFIYNRYGETVFKTNDPLKKWNGRYKGQMLAGNYVWYASYLYRGKANTQKGNLLIVK